MASLYVSLSSSDVRLLGDDSSSSEESIADPPTSQSDADIEMVARGAA